MKNTTRQYRILIVDDDENLRNLLRLSIERENMRADVAEDGVVAENLLRQRNYDLMVTDLRMPRKHGHQLVSEVLGRVQHPMVIVLTGVIEPRLVADLFARGVTDVLSKPLDHAIFAVKVRALLDRGPSVPTPSQASATASVTGQIDQASAALQAQLVQITDSFNATIDNLTKQKEDLEVGFLNSVRMFTNMMEESGRSGESHAGRVEVMAMALGETTSLTSSEKHVLEIAALVHDIGQFGMPDTVRNKAPWLLDPDERAIYRRYPLIGAALLSEMPGAMKIAELIEQHSENFDGSGFPWGMNGENTSLSARIIRIADGTDTFLQHARGENAIEQAHEHLRSMRGVAYDPELVPAAMKYVAEYLTFNKTIKTVRLPADQLRPGLALAENVFDMNGHFLARKGATLTLAMTSHLRSLIGNQDVSVIDPKDDGQKEN